jgi:hypothetical protein
MNTIIALNKSEISAVFGALRPRPRPGVFHGQLNIDPVLNFNNDGRCVCENFLWAATASFLVGMVLVGNPDEEIYIRNSNTTEL